MAKCYELPKFYTTNEATNEWMNGINIEILKYEWMNENGNILDSVDSTSEHATGNWALGGQPPVTSMILVNEWTISNRI